MSRSIIIIGAGGHGRVCADVALRCGYDVTGFCDLKPGGGGQINGLPVISHNEADLFAAWPEDHELCIALGDNAARLHCAAAAQRAGVPLAVLIDPSAVVSSSAQIAAGTVVMPQAVVNANAEIGRCVILNTACTVDHDCRLGDGVLIGPGANLAGGVSVGAYTLIGTGAAVAPGVTIGEDATIAAGAAVAADIPDGIRVAGVPAKPIQG